MPNQNPVAVVGAGPAGLTAAYQLSKRHPNVQLYEAGPQVGGLARSFDLWGQRVDLGPHRFFSADARVNRLWLEVVGTDYAMVDRLTRIFYRGRFFYYPLRPFNALGQLGMAEALRVLWSYGQEKLRPTAQDGSFEAWVTNRFGRRLFEIFFQTYSEKLWGIPCTELDADFAAQRIRQLSLWAAVRNALLAPKGQTTHKTLVDQFAFPHGGTGAVYERMAERLVANGGQLHLNRPVDRVLTENGRVTALLLADGTQQPVEAVVSSMPLTLLVDRLPQVPTPVRQAAAQLTFRNTVLVYLQVEGDNHFPDNWLYVHSPGLAVGRITNFRNWSPTLTQGQPGTILAMEYWCNTDDPEWTWDDAQHLARAQHELRQTGLVGQAAFGNGHVVRIPRCYPVYRRGYRAQLAPVVDYLRTIPNLHAIGRYGAFKYNNQDHSILMGMLAAENVLDQAGHDLWAVNADDTYQEGAVITATGLKPLP